MILYVYFIHVCIDLCYILCILICIYVSMYLGNNSFDGLKVAIGKPFTRIPTYMCRSLLHTMYT
jgi:hypothetical protein